MKWPRRILLASLLSGPLAAGSDLSGQDLRFRPVAGDASPSITLSRPIPLTTPSVKPVSFQGTPNARGQQPEFIAQPPMQLPPPMPPVSSGPARTPPPQPFPTLSYPPSAYPQPAPPPSASMWPMLPAADLACPAPGAPPAAFETPPCPTGPRAWFGAEYLYFWLTQPQAPPLVTTSPAGTPFAIAGNYGLPTTSTVYGGDLGQTGQSGVRISGGTYFTPNSLFGVEAEGFYLFQGTTSFFASSDAAGNPILARPRYNPILNREAATLISYPGAYSGNINITTQTTLWGAELNGLFRPAPNSPFRFFAGLRYLNLEDELDITQQSTILARGAGAFLGNAIPVGSVQTLYDQFQARNQFYGGQLGAGYRFGMNRFSVDLIGKVALGVTHQTVDISGFTAVRNPTLGPAPGGLLAQPTNMGSQSQNVFGIVPEGRIQFNYRVNPHVSLFAGYNVIYWNSVVRSVEQVDRVVNTTQVPSSGAYQPALVGPARPTPLFQQSSLWVQGVNLGVLFTY